MTITPTEQVACICKVADYLHEAGRDGICFFLENLAAVYGALFTVELVSALPEKERFRLGEVARGLTRYSLARSQA